MSLNIKMSLNTKTWILHHMSNHNTETLAQVLSVNFEKTYGHDF